VLGAILLVGSIGFLDLRIMGYGRGLPAERLTQALTPLALAGFTVMVSSGAIMFLADARALAGSPLFLAKLALIGFAGLNALAFRLKWRRVADEASGLARMFATLSLCLWLAVAVLGRLIAYF
jgi:hypothetical protein